MKKILKTTLFIFMIFVFTISLTTNVSAQENNDSKIVKLIDDEVSELINNKSAKGAIASIVKDDKVLLCKGYGYADEKSGIKADENNTAFRIGSISKTFVALSALQLVQEGKLDMNVPISQYLGDDFPKFQYPITM